MMGSPKTTLPCEKGRLTVDLSQAEWIVNDLLVAIASGTIGRPVFLASLISPPVTSRRVRFSKSPDDYELSFANRLRHALFSGLAKICLVTMTLTAPLATQTDLPIGEQEPASQAGAFVDDLD